MAKFAYVVTKWIGTGTEDDFQRPEVASEVGYCEDVTGQFVKLADKSPDPNLVVVKVGELRSPKHDGMIDAVKADDRFLVLEEWEVDAEGVAGPYNKHAALGQLRAWLAQEGVDPQIANAIVAEKRTAQLIAMCRQFGRR